MRSKDNGDRKCLFEPCGGTDSYFHIRYECQFYSTKYVDTKTDPNKDNAVFLVKLDEERRKRFKVNLIFPLPVL